MRDRLLRAPCEDAGAGRGGGEVSRHRRGLRRALAAHGRRRRHYRLAFDRPDTWSQKYNLAWDTVFGLGLFPPEVMRKELAFYRGKRLAYGTPLDSRSPAAKPEWAIWVATTAESKETFEEFAAPIHRYVDETPNRVPLADIYFAHTGRRRANQARSVVGGFYMKLLAERLKG